MTLESSLSMANYRIGRKRGGVTWSNNVIEGNGRLVFKGDLEFAMDRYTTPLNLISDPGPAITQIARSNAPHAKTWVEHIADDHTKCGYRFVPLISTTGGFTCSLDILFLRRDNPGNLITDGGDIDNRIKTLFDGLKMPTTIPELGGYDVPAPGENPFFCLLEDDSLITKVAVTTDRLLIPLDTNAGERLNDVHLVIHVTMSNPSAVFAGNRLV